MIRATPVSMCLISDLCVKFRGLVGETEDAYLGMGTYGFFAGDLAAGFGLDGMVMMASRGEVNLNPCDHMS